MYTGEVSVEKYDDIFQKSIKDPVTFWGEAADAIN